MKKHLLVAAFAAITTLASAQSFSIVDGAIGSLNGGTFNYWVSTSVTDTRIATVTNTSAANLNVKVRKSILQLNDAGATVWFCTDQNCYAPSTALSSQFTMGASGGLFDLTYDFNPNNATGVTQVRYSVINQANPADSAWFIVVYNLSNSPTGVVNANVGKPSVSNPMPNPASSVFSMNYKLGSAASSNAKVVVYNMLGSVVMENPVNDSEGVVKMDVSTLDQGIYFCTLESDGKALATRRLVVSH